MTDPIKAKIQETPCWIWPGTIYSTGYAVKKLNKRRFLVHREFYQATFGQIPLGKQLDHLCRTRACVNPFHLEPVTVKENVLRGEGITARYARQTHCVKGHSLSGANLYQLPKGGRGCRACRKQHQIKFNEKKHG